MQRQKVTENWAEKMKQTRQEEIGRHVTEIKSQTWNQEQCVCIKERGGFSDEREIEIYLVTQRRNSGTRF
jgi:hypothetical protein